MTATTYKAGTRLKSAVCDTQIMILRIPPTPVTITCGGHPVLPMAETPAAGITVDAAHAEGTLTGKRYVDEAESLEFLCTKGGAGGLAIDGVALGVKQAKALPSSD